MNSNILEWSVDEVVYWITRELGIININVELLKAHELNGRDLIDLTEDNLKDDLNILKLHDRKFILRKICEKMKNILKEDPSKDNAESQYCNKSSNLVVQIKYENLILKLKSSENLKIEHLIKDCVDYFSIDKSKIVNLFLFDRNGIILAKENFVVDVLENMELYSLVQVNSNQSATLPSSNTSHQNVNNSNKIKKFSSITETALKNRYISFEALDNLDKEIPRSKNIPLIPSIKSSALNASKRRLDFDLNQPKKNSLNSSNGNNNSCSEKMFEKKLSTNRENKNHTSSAYESGEIENFLKSMHNKKSTTFMMNSNIVNDSQFKLEQKAVENKNKRNPINLRHLLYKNITSSLERNCDSSISN